MLLPGEPSEHQADHADLNLSFARTRLPLVIPAVNPASAQPSESPFHYPAPLDHLEGIAPGWTTHHLDHVPAVCGYPTIQAVIVVLVVRPELLQAGELLPAQLLEDLRGRRPVVGRGGGDGHRQEQTQGVHHDMALPPLDLLGPVIAVRAADLGGLDGLAVDAAGAGRRLATGPATDPPRKVSWMDCQVP